LVDIGIHLANYFSAKEIVGSKEHWKKITAMSTNGHASGMQYDVRDELERLRCQIIYTIFPPVNRTKIRPELTSLTFPLTHTMPL
jgi:hypothetical protein